MAYTDEEILEKREQRKKEIYTTLEEGMYLGGEVVSFERKELFGTFSIMLPVSWGQMPVEYARIKYPSKFRPQIILTSADLDIQMKSQNAGVNVAAETAIMLQQGAAKVEIKDDINISGGKIYMN